MEGWNGKSFFLEPNFTPAEDLQLSTDASGSTGFGAYFNGQWLNGGWSQDQQGQIIAWKELYAILGAAAAWAPAFHRKRIMFHCDNSAVISMIASGSSTNSAVMRLMRSLFNVCA